MPVHHVFGRIEPIGATIADGEEADIREPEEVRQQISRPIADANGAESDPVAGSDRSSQPQDGAGHEQWQSGGRPGPAQKMAAA